MQQISAHPPAAFAKRASYGMYVTAGALVVGVVTGVLFLWSGKHILPPIDPSGVPTPSQAVSPVPQTGAAPDDIEVLGTEAHAFDVSTLDTQLGVIDQDK